MRKLQIICLLFFFAQISQAFSQGIREWIDGVPYFTHLDSSQNVIIDSVISLTPLYGTAAQSSSFRFILTGADWFWPDNIRIVSAEDIDYRKFLGADLYLVTDGAGRRVVEVDPSIPQEVWEFQGALGTPQYLGHPVDAASYLENEGEEAVRKILITDQGRHRVIKVIQQNKAIQWQYGNEIEGKGKNQLSNPADAIPIPDSGRVFICDKGNNRVILVQQSDTSVVWFYDELNTPVDIEYKASTSEVLITDQSNHRVIIVNKNTKAITWQFGTNNYLPDSLNRGLNLPIDADFLPNGNILICDKGNNRIIEVNSAKQVVWEFGRRIKNLKDADRLTDNKHLIVTGNLPERLGYKTTDFISQAKDVGRKVNFDSLFWEADTIPGITSLKLQIRSAENNLSDLEAAPWQGPTSVDSFYVSPGTAINPFHDGHRFYQFKAKLATNNPLYTPILTNVKLSYKYYDTGKTGRIVSEIISDSTNYIITQWNNLKYNTVLPKNLTARNQVETRISIVDAATNASIRSFTASTVDSVNEQAISNIEALRQKQAIRLQVTFKTNNTSVTPRLNMMSINWNRTYSTTSHINFVDQNFAPVTHYRFSEGIIPGQPHIDRVEVFLSDPNFEQVQDVVALDIFALSSYDRERVNLTRLATGGYLLQPSMPGIILTTGIPAVNNGFLEVFDRDTLTITYADPTNPSDVSVDRALIIQDTNGEIVFEDQNKITVTNDTIVINSTEETYFAYILIKNENDRNILLSQDSISITLKDVTTSDTVSSILVELKGSGGTFNTGEFRSANAIPIKLGIGAISEDGIMQTKGGSAITFDYNDSHANRSPIYVKSVVSDTSLPRFNPNAGIVDFDIAPNPYYARQNVNLNLRASSSIGTLQITKIEIFSLNGEKITEINGAQLSFYYNTHPIPINQYAYANNWWSLRNLNGDQVSSGTYFVKVSGKIAETGNKVYKIKKMVIIR